VSALQVSAEHGLPELGCPVFVRLFFISLLKQGNKIPALPDVAVCQALPTLLLQTFSR